MEKLPVINATDLSKVDNPLLNAKQLNTLLSETPKDHIYERPAKGGGKWQYVTGVYVKKVLNMVFGWNWSFEVKKFEYNMESKQCMILGRLTVNVKDRSIVKEQFGRSDIAFKTEPVLDGDGKPVMLKLKNGENVPKRQSTSEPLDLGNDLKAATTDALKKCASELGIASDIYGADEFKNIRIANDSDADIIRDFQRQISEKLAYCQDQEFREAIRGELLEAEAHGINDLNFYTNIIKRFE